MIGARVIEISENLKGERIATVTTDRGEEFLVNMEQAAIAVCLLKSELLNEEHFGWQLKAPWYREEMGALFQRSELKLSPAAPLPPGNAGAKI